MGQQICDTCWKHHRRNVLYGEGLAGRVAGDAASQKEALAPGSHHQQGPTIVAPQNDNSSYSNTWL